MVSLRKIVTGGLVALSLGAASGCASTESGEIGVVYCKWLCGDNIMHVIEPGRTEFLFPPRYETRYLNIEMQSFLMTKDPHTGDRTREDDLVFKTKEGNNIGQDVVVTWRLDLQKADYIIQNMGTNLDDIKEKYIRPITRTIVRDEFNKLDSREFYESQRRFEAAERATKRLQTMLSEYGIIIDRVSPRDYRFEDEKYQTAINNAKNAGQDRQRFEQEKTSKEELWKKKLNEEKGQSNEVIAKAEGDKAAAIHNADAKFVAAQNKAQGIITQMEAQATAITAFREAMASQGGDVAVKMEYARHFKPEEITIVPCENGGNGLSLNYLDLNRLFQEGQRK